MADYTKAQKAAIDRAFAVLDGVVSNRSHRDEYQFREAVKSDRKDRGSITATRALLVEAFLDGFHGKVSTVADLYSYTQEGRTLAIIGAQRATDSHNRPTSEMVAVMWAGVEAWSTAIQTRLNVS